MEKTRGVIESEFSKAMVRFELEHLGRGPVEVRTRVLDDMLFVRLRGILTPAEQRLSANPDGRQLVKELRRELFETSRDLLAALVNDVTGAKLMSMYTDMSTVTGERIVVFVVDEDLGKKYPVSRRPV